MRILFSTHPNIWSMKKKSIRPKLNKNQFQEAVAFYIKLSETNVSIDDKKI